jgi:hypothetical protein
LNWLSENRRAVFIYSKDEVKRLSKWFLDAGQSDMKDFRDLQDHLYNMECRWPSSKKERPKANMESAGKRTAKIGEPGVRASSPVNSSVDSIGGGQVKYDLNHMSAEEQAAFRTTAERHSDDVVGERTLWDKLKGSIPMDTFSNLVDKWVMRGGVYLPPSFG